MVGISTKQRVWNLQLGSENKSYQQHEAQPNLENLATQVVPGPKQ